VSWRGSRKDRGGEYGSRVRMQCRSCKCGGFYLESQFEYKSLEASAELTNQLHQL
jgi:hypothetical protein